MELVSLTNARERGLKTYFTGKPCKSGHISERYITQNRCIECNKARGADYYLTNTDRIKSLTKTWAQENRDKTTIYKQNWKNLNIEHNKAINVAYRVANKEKVAAYARFWRASNPERYTANHRLSRELNRGRYNAIEAKRRAAKLQRTPAWADLELIKLFYKESARLTKETGIEYHVDHIVPLQGENVCGLHVHYNLQVITATENISKSNTFHIE